MKHLNFAHSIYKKVNILIIHVYHITLSKSKDKIYVMKNILNISVSSVVRYRELYGKSSALRTLNNYTGFKRATGFYIISCFLKSNDNNY